MKSIVIRELPIMQSNSRWWFGCWIEQITDGDTYVVTQDFGMGIHMEGVILRGYDYDTWETRNRPKGLDDQQWELHKLLGKAATAACEKWMPPGHFCMINTFKVRKRRTGKLAARKGKHGRYLVRIYAKTRGGWIDVAESLKAGGHLKRKP
jgi:hypothetical protein